MRAVEIQAFGPDGLAIVDRPEPEATGRRVVVRIHAVSLNFRDLLMVGGLYNPKLKFPLVPCSDGAGEVVAVGPEVTRFKPGDRVCGTFFQRWDGGRLTEEASRSTLGGAIDGVLAELVAFEEGGCVAIPHHLSYEEAATLPCAALTAWNALFVAGGLQPGDSVLALGTGGVSIFAMQFAVMAGAKAIVTSSSDAKLEHARLLGASAGINYREHPEWHDPVREATGGLGTDVVVEVGGAGTFNRSIRAVRRGGTIAMIGVLAGAGDVNLTALLMNGLKVQGIYVGSREMFEDMNRAITQHALRPVIDRTFGFDEVREAYAYLQSGAHFGKVCVRVEPN